MLVTLHVKQGLVVMVTAVFVPMDMKESFAKEVCSVRALSNAEH